MHGTRLAVKLVLDLIAAGWTFFTHGAVEDLRQAGTDVDKVRSNLPHLKYASSSGNLLRAAGTSATQ